MLFGDGNRTTINPETDVGDHSKADSVLLWMPPAGQYSREHDAK